MERAKEMLMALSKLAIEKVLPVLAAKLDVIARFTIEELPKVESWLLELFEIMFSPRQLMRQLVIVTVVQLLIMAGDTIANIGNSLVVFLSKAEREQQEVMKELSMAASYQEWKKVAARLDYMRYEMQFTCIVSLPAYSVSSSTNVPFHCPVLLKLPD